MQVENPTPFVGYKGRQTERYAEKQAHAHTPNISTP